MKVIIVEDEKPSAEHIELLLQKIDDSIQVVSYIDSVKAAVNLFKSGIQADLIFLDIHLSDGNSFDIFSQVEVDIPIVFTTAFNNYAIQAFKQNSVDYLLKPISLKDLKFSIDKFKNQRQVISKQLIENIASAVSQNKKDFKHRFMVKIGQNIHTIPSEEILYFETRDSATYIVTGSKSKYLIDYSLDELETFLDPKVFFRINRKIIISIKSIEKVEIYFNSRLAIISKVLSGDERIVSRERVNDFKKWLDA